MTRVLLLDDDVELRALLRTALVARGLEVVVAGSAREADEVLGAVAVELVVVDGLLPDYPGLEFIERLRRRDRGIRVVFLSAFFRELETFKRLTEELDVSLVAYKPVDPSSFAERVAELAAARSPGALSTAGADSSGGPALALEFAELRRNYGARIPEKLAELGRAVDEARLDFSRLDDARVFAHRLRGSAGSYGYATVGQAVGIVDDLLAEAAVRGAHPTARLWTDVDAAMGDARLVASRAREERQLETQGPATRALLVVDDDPEFLHVVRSTARKLVVEVITAQSSDEAIQRAQTRPLLAAILDVHLHGEDSFRLAREIRSTKDNADIAIAFISADRRIETRVAAIEAGGTLFIDKPTSPENLGQVLQHFVRESQTQQGRVLIVDDDCDIMEHYSRYLSAAGFFVEQLPSADRLVETLEETRPDVLLLDVNLPRVSGIDVCRALRMSERWAMLPVLLVTAQTDSATRLGAFRAGASDVIVKPVLPEELLARVSVQQERVRLLRERADRDSLSGLCLRRAFLEGFDRALAECTRAQRPMSLVLLDIDHFKRVNDTHGHLAGDEVIVRLGELLRRRFRTEDLRGRWGGEEFVLAFPGQEASFAIQAAEHLLADFRALRFAADDGTSFSASFTAGVAAYPGDGASMSAVMRRADELLYVGKRTGRCRVVGSAAVTNEETHAGAVPTTGETR